MAACHGPCHRFCRSTIHPRHWACGSGARGWRLLWHAGCHPAARGSRTLGALKWEPNPPTPDPMGRGYVSKTRSGAIKFLLEELFGRFFGAQLFGSPLHNAGQLGRCGGQPYGSGHWQSPTPVDTTKTRSDPQRVRMSCGERPIGTAKGKQPHTEALCQPPPPLQTPKPTPTGEQPLFSPTHLFFFPLW